MKKILLPLALLSAVLVSCSKDEINENNGNNGNLPDEPVYEISISPEDLTFGAEGGEQTVTVTSSEKWHINGACDWCEASALRGENGDAVIFTAKPYPNETRTAVFTFSCGDKNADLIITQVAKEYSISVEPTELTFDVEGGEEEITVTSSDNWSLSGVPEWISVSGQEGENGAVVTVTVGYNDNANSRSGVMLFICGDKKATVTVTQQPDNSPIQFKDPYFLEALLETYTIYWNNIEYRVDVDQNNDGQISKSEASSVQILNLKVAAGQTGHSIRNVDELSYFTGLRYLRLYAPEESLDLSNLSQLELLEVQQNLTSLDVSGCTALTVLDCSDNQLTSLDLSNNTALTYLYCWNNQLTSLDLSNNTALTDLDCGDNQLTSLDLSNNTALTDLDCRSNQLTSLDLSNNTALTDLNCWNNQLTSLDLSNNTALTDLDCSDNQLTSLDLSNNTALTDLDCRSNQLTSLDLSNNTALTYLCCYSNQLTSLDLSECTKLDRLYCVSFMITGDYPYEFDYIIPETKCPLESLKIYKYHTIWEPSMKATKEAYGSVIEYVE